MNNYLILIITGVSLNAIAQIFLKKGMLTLGYFEFTASNTSFSAIKNVIKSTTMDGDILLFVKYRIMATCFIKGGSQLCLPVLKFRLYINNFPCLFLPR